MGGLYLQCFEEQKSQMIFYKWYTDNCTLYFVSFDYVLSTCFLSPFSVSWADIRYPVQMTSSRRRPNLYGGRSTYSLSSTVPKLRIKIFMAVVSGCHFEDCNENATCVNTETWFSDALTILTVTRIHQYLHAAWIILIK